MSLVRITLINATRGPNVVQYFRGNPCPRKVTFFDAVLPLRIWMLSKMLKIQKKRKEDKIKLDALSLSHSRMQLLGLMVMAWKLLRRHVEQIESPHATL